MKSVSKTALWLIGVFLIGWLVAITYGDNHQFEATLYDDEDFVIGPATLEKGLTGDTLGWAFTADLLYESPNVEYYSPLTLITRLTDHSLYADWAGGHHLTSVLLHWINSMLLLVFLYQVTRRFGVSLFFAAIFAVHPLNVEAVSWLSARKDLLCASFALLTLIGYVAYARQPTRWRFVLFNVAFVAGLLSKPMLVTLPFVLLLLDWWPLGRWPRALGLSGFLGWRGENALEPIAPVSTGSMRERWRILLEKGPMFLLVVIASLMAWLSQRDYGALRSLDTYPLSVRLANCVTSYGTYLRRLLWPDDLGVIYHLHRTVPSWGAVMVVGLLLAGLVWLALRQLKARPWIFVGLAWFAGTLVPVIGLVQIGDGAMADRYAYIANIGLFVALGMLLSEGIAFLAAKFRAADGAVEPGAIRVVLPVLALGALVVGAFTLVARQQAATWENSVTLFERARAVSPESAAVHLNLASAYLRLARLQDAERELAVTVELEPRSYMAHYNLGVLAERRGDYASAVEAFRQAGRLNPQSPEVVHSLVRGLFLLGRRNEAHALMKYALKNLPAKPETMRQLAALALPLGYVREAQGLLLQADQMAPPDADSLNVMGFTFLAEDRKVEAENCFRRAIDLFPTDARSYLNLSRLYIQMDRREDARVVLEEGLGRAWDRDRLRDQLAALVNKQETPPQ